VWEYRYDVVTELLYGKYRYGVVTKLLYGYIDMVL
jgi:hypothetical protein